MFSLQDQDKDYRVYILFFVVAFLCYANSLTGELLSDDIILVVRNLNAHHFSTLYKLFLQNSFHTIVDDGTYRPISNLTFGFNYLIHGEHTFGYHLVNTLLHGINAVLLYELTLQITKKPFLAFGCSIIFLVHPVRVEAVSFISARHEPLAALFSFLAIRTYYSRRLALSALMFALGLLSKESAIVLPGVILLLDAYIDRKPPSIWLKQRLLPVAVYAGVTVAYLAVRYAVLGKLTVPIENTVFKTAPLMTRVLTMADGFLEYFRLLVWPVTLRFEYDFSIIPPQNALTLAAVTKVALIIAVLAFGIAIFSRLKTISFSILFFFLTLSTVSNILTPTGILIAERVLYIPAISFGLIVCYFLDKLYSSNLRKLAIVILIVISGAFATRTILRNRDWQSREAYIAAFVRDVPNSPKSALLDGYRKLESGDIKGAEQAFLRVIELEPTSAGSYVILGDFYSKQLKLDQSRALYEKALSIASQDATALLGLARLDILEGNYTKALQLLEKVQEKIPDSEFVFYDAAYACYQLEQLDKAKEYLQKAFAINKNQPTILLLAARVAIKQRDFNLAETTLAEVKALDPENAEYYIVRGLLELARQRYEAALDAFDQARRGQINSAELNYATALAFFYQNKFTLARKFLQDTLRLQPNHSAAAELLQKLPKQ